MAIPYKIDTSNKNMSVHLTSTLIRLSHGGKRLRTLTLEYD